MNSPPRILRATPWREAAPKLALMFMPAVIVLAVGKLVLFPWIKTYIEAAQSRAEIIDRVQLVLDWFAVPLLAAAMYSVWLALRVFQTGEWPLPGTLVVKDTVVTQGRWAYARAVVFLIVAVAFVAITIMLLQFPHLFAQGHGA